MRYLECRLPPPESLLLLEVLVDLYRKFKEEGPFECILGHSEGAVIAATFVVDILKKSAEGDDIVPPKCAVFMNGMVPHTADGNGLYHLCDEDLAIMVDHGRGHGVPRDAKSCELMSRAIRDTMDRTGGGANVETSCMEQSG